MNDQLDLRAAQARDDLIRALDAHAFARPPAASVARRAVLRRRTQTGLAISAVLVVVFGAALAVGSGPNNEVARPGAPDVSVNAYPLPDDIESVAKLARHSDVVIGKVEAIRKPRWNSPDREGPRAYGGISGGDPHHIFTPIDVSVQETVNGSLKGGDRIVIRALSRTIGQDRFSSADWPGADVYRPGQRVLLVLNGFVDAGDGLVASTPNFVYVLSGDEATLWNGRYSVEIKTLVEKIRAEASRPTS